MVGAKLAEPVSALKRDGGSENQVKCQQQTEISAAPVGDLELVTALLDLDEGESVEEGEEKERDEVEDKEGEG